MHSVHQRLPAQKTDANGDPVRLNFTDSEKAALVTFLRTLTDESIANEEKWRTAHGTELSYRSRNCHTLCENSFLTSDPS